MNINPKPPKYRTFLLTFWEERDEETNSPAHWRFRLEDPRTGEKHGFNKVEDLLAALTEVMDQENEP